MLREFYALTGDEHAAAYLLSCADVASLADDIADGDSLDPQADMARLLRVAMVEIPSNLFFQRNATALIQAQGLTVSLWDVSNTFQKSKDGQKNVFGYVYRHFDDVLLMAVVALCRGWEHAAQSFPAQWERLDHGGRETVADWVGEVQ